MKQPVRLTAIIEREDDGFVALCPQLDIASQGSSIEEARSNLIEALTLFFEAADQSEVARRLHGEVSSPRSKFPYSEGAIEAGFPQPVGDFSADLSGFKLGLSLCPRYA